MPRKGFRERKKRSTRGRIQECGLGLFVALGFDQTTIEQVGVAAEISTRTIGRYFSSKEQIVLDGLVDTALADAIEDAPAGLDLVSAIRVGIRETYRDPQEQIHLRFMLIVRTPSLQHAMYGAIHEVIKILATAIARRNNRPVDDLAVATLAGAVAGVSLSAFIQAVEQGETDFDDYLCEVDCRLAQLDCWIGAAAATALPSSISPLSDR
ncbi:acyl-CoA-like ligand-binding transcription factor [Nocardia pseudovaccinii]|uniref:acyl-CoA-like ligand-binding transcription factor n=1 Tax=Nocardia pseudovaccinii TaxID=189540 RepID=UPI0014723337|nr:TetR family transcriptional regulator [Nocardia pseudovaccinii]